MADAITNEQREARWWADWWDDDYSWEGLAKHRIAGIGAPNGARTLQDYWRRDPETGAIRTDQMLLSAGELVGGQTDTAGILQMWHIAHVPLCWADGTPAKSMWDKKSMDALATLISIRITKATGTGNISEGELITGIDGRAQLSGAIMCIAPSHQGGVSAAIHIISRHAYFPIWRTKSQLFGRSAHFDGSIFTGIVEFQDATFEGHAAFRYSTFLHSINFQGAKFCSRAVFLHPSSLMTHFL